MKYNKIIGLFLVGIVSLAIISCSTPMKTSQYTKPGFSNINDIPLPESAKIDLDKSMVMGGDNSWTGHLVYNTNKSVVEVIGFINAKMQENGWMKISEVRGTQSVITFMKNKRVATITIAKDKGYFTKNTKVSIVMANSQVRTAFVNASKENS